MEFTNEICLSICLDGAHEYFENKLEEIRNDLNLDFKYFERLLIKTPLEEYTKYLFEYGLVQYYFSQNCWGKANKKIENDFSYELSLIDSLIFFSLDVAETTLTFKKGELKGDNLTIDNYTVLKIIKSSIYNSFMLNNRTKDEDHFIDILTLKEAEDELRGCGSFDSNVNHKIENKEVLNWIKDYIGNYKYKEDNLKELQEASFENADLWINHKIINTYSLEHHTDREYNIQNLKIYRDNLIRHIGRKTGARPKNDDLALLAEKISYLIRIKKFLSQKEINDIEKFPISDYDCNLVYEYLLFFKLIKPQEKSEKENTTTPTKSIRTLINNFRKNRKEEVFEKTGMVDTETTINKYYKTGEYFDV